MTNVHLKGRVTTRASIIQEVLSVLATKDTLSMVLHIVEVSAFVHVYLHDCFYTHVSLVCLLSIPSLLGSINRKKMTEENLK